MRVKCHTSLAKIFPDRETDYIEKKSFSCLKNERLSFQITYSPELTTRIRFEISCDTLKDFSVYNVGFVPSLKVCNENHDDYLISYKPGLYPDLLSPYNGEEIIVMFEQWRSFWIEVATNEETQAGKHVFKYTFKDDSGKIINKGRVTLDVINAVLPEQELICTHWFHTDCLMTYYNMEAFSDKYWSTVENFMKTAAEHGINSLLVPLFTPPLDTAIGAERPTVQLVDVEVKNGEYSFGYDKFIKWIELSKKCGLKYFEFSHLFTQGGAEHAPKIMATVDGEHKKIFGWETDSDSEEYVNFLEKFAETFKPVIKKLGIEKTCMFHVSDEPGEDVIESYSKCSAVVSRLFGEYQIIDALSSYEFYKRGLVKTPIPATPHAEDFYKKVEQFWVYYCCGPANDYYSNRFFAMPSQRTRVLGYQMYKYDVKGFLHWGYNFWYSQLSKYPINPYVTSDAGCAFPSGDGYVVYPGDNGEALCSIRLKAFSEGLQDMRALQLLEKYTSRQQCERMLNRGNGGPITFNSYPRSEKWHIELREKINKKIKEFVK